MIKHLLIFLILSLFVFAHEQELKLEDETKEQKAAKDETTNKDTPKELKIQVNVVDYLQKMSPSQLINRFWFQACAIGLIVIYLFNYTIGKRKNKQLAYTWLRSVGPTLQNNFASVGFDPSGQEMYMLEESGSEFIFYCSGRDNVDCAEFNLQLEPRQDILANYIISMISPMKDIITVDIPVYSTIPLVFYIIKKRDVKSVKAKAIDMSITKQFDVANFPETYRIFGENVESVDHIVNNQVINMIKQLPGVFNSLHYTDQKVYSNSTGHLRVMLNPSKEGEKNQLAIKMIFYILERIESLKLSQNAKVKCEQSREVLMASKQRQQLQKKRDQLQKQKAQRKKKQEMRIKSLPPEKQKKEYEKQKKRELKQVMKTRTVKM